MNYYLAAFYATIVGILSLFFWKYSWIKGKEYLILCLIFSLPLSPIVNIFIKRPIFYFLHSFFNISVEFKNWPLWPMWLIFIVSIIGPICEEAIKLFPVIILTKLFSVSGVGVYLLGILSGVGFGISEAWYAGYSLFKSPKYSEYATGLGNLLGLILGFAAERILAILAHWMLTAIVAYGILIKEPIKYFFVAVLLHFLINIPAVLYQKYKMPLAGLATVVIFVVLFTSFFLKIEQKVAHNYSCDRIKEDVLYEKKN